MKNGALCSFEMVTEETIRLKIAGVDTSISLYKKICHRIYVSAHFHKGSLQKRKIYVFLEI